ncbi:hypothetical protein, partial [Enterococcus sp. 7E2_DIV0204]|uniref:hypothetical protein n=1 Tax=Enterococcus sp. 7E2_DIV0204 TaxID=1834188 RepID=UPI001C391271
MFLILLILIQCLIIFLIHLYFDHLDSKNVDFLSTLQASNLLSVQTSLNTNLVWGVLLLIASFILESNSLLYIKTGLSEILYNNRLYIYIVACILNIFSTYMLKQSIAKIDIYLKKSTDLEKSTTLLLNYYEKQIELAERRLNLFKSFSFLPVVILFINNLNSLKQSNTNIQFESLIFIDPINVYLLL